MYESRHDAYLESRVLSADPLELVSLLYQGAMGAVQDARHFLAQGEIAQRSRAISKACAILSELAGALNHEGGGEVAARLAALYDYMQRKLLEANFHQSDAPLGEVLGLLRTLSEAWVSLQRPKETSAPETNQWAFAAAQEVAAVHHAGSWSF